MVGRAAVEHDAGAHPVGVAPHGAAARRCWPATASPGRSRVASSKTACCHAMPRGPSASAKCVISVMSVDLRQRIQARPCAAVGPGREPEPVHAAVHLQEHALRLLRLVRREPVDLLAAMHHMPEVQARAKLQVARLEGAFEQQDRPAPAQCTHALGLGQVEQREPVGAAQALESTLDAMAIGIGLDHGPDARVGGGLAHPLQVVRQGIDVNQGFDRARHRVRILTGAACYKPCAHRRRQAGGDAAPRPRATA